MEQIVCPYLGAIDNSQRRAPHAPFPSFENQCLASGIPELIMLGDQASYCLSPGCTACPRFQAASQRQDNGEPAPAFVPFYATAEEAWHNRSRTAGAGVVGLENLDDLAGGQPPVVGRRWAWLGAGLIFVLVLACGSLTAAYTGWDWMNRHFLATASTGRVGALSAAATGAPQAAFIVVTATPVVVVLPPTAPVVVAANQAQAPAAAPLATFPSAVTPTPITINPDGVGGQAAVQPPGGDPGVARRKWTCNCWCPARRPTPVFDLPTSTPPEVPPTDTPTVTPAPLGTPIIVFGADDHELMKDKCTTVRWSIKNVREVYYENQAMNGTGEREECMDNRSQVYTLQVVLGDGQSQIFTTTVAYLPPTPTITPTPSFTPEPVFTPTWTPVPVTPTPPANTRYSASLAANGSTALTCAAGETCEMQLLAINTGSGVDNISLKVVAPGQFPVQLCRPDGVCGPDNLPLTDVGPGNTAFVTVRFSIPADSASQSTSAYGFQASSLGSGGAVVSTVIAANVTVK